MKKIIVLLAVCLSCLVSCGQLNNQAGSPPPPLFKGVWEIDSQFMPKETAEFKLVITDSLFIMNVLTTSKERAITKCSYTFDDSAIYLTIINVTINGVEEPKATGEKAYVLYSLNNGILTIVSNDNSKTTFHRVE